MKHADSGREALITQVGVELRQVGGHHQALVDDVLVGEAAHVKGAVVSEGDLGPAAREEQLDAELALIHSVAGDEHLLDARQAFQGQLTQYAGIDRDFAPANQSQALSGDFFAQTSPRLFRFGGVRVQKDHPDGVLRRQFGVEMLPRHGAQEGVRLLHEQTAAVTRFTIGIDAATVSHAGQGLNGSL